jgi:hypothetical protein
MIELKTDTSIYTKEIIGLYSNKPLILPGNMD